LDKCRKLINIFLHSIIFISNSNVFLVEYLALLLYNWEVPVSNFEPMTGKFDRFSAIFLSFYRQKPF